MPSTFMNRELLSPIVLANTAPGESAVSQLAGIRPQTGGSIGRHVTNEPGPTYVNSDSLDVDDPGMRDG